MVASLAPEVKRAGAAAAGPGSGTARAGRGGGDDMQRQRLALIWLLGFAAWGCDDGEPEVTDGGAASDAAVATDGGGAPIDSSLPDGDVDGAPVADAGPADLGPDGTAPDAGPRCGDGRLDEGEACDDGNGVAGDGCDERCQIERQRTVEPDGRDQPLVLRFGPDGEAQADFALDPADDADWFAFTLDAPADIALVVDGGEGLRCMGDPSLTLFADAAAALLNVEDGPTGLCPVAAPGTHPRLGGLAAGRYVIRVAGLLEPSPALRLIVRKLSTLAPGDACTGAGETGRCPRESRCGQRDLETDVGRCMAAGCGDWLRDDGEGCDAPDAFCGDGCVLAGATAQEPNEAPEAASAPGPSLIAGLADLQIVTTLEGLADVDFVRVPVPIEGAELEAVLFDGFFACPGPVRLAATDADGTALGRTEQACGGLTVSVPAGQGVAFLRLNTDDAGVVGRPLLLFLTVTPRAAVGEACEPPGAGPQCQAGAWCIDARCVADRCGDGRQGPDEACDDGNQAPGDGCNAACVREFIRLDPPGGSRDVDLPAGADLRVRFTLAEPMALEARTGHADGGCPADTELVLLDAAGLTVAANDDLSANNPCSALSEVLVAGQYDLAVRHRAPELVRGLRVSLSFQPVAADGEACGPDRAPCGPGSYCGDDGRCAAHRCQDGVLAPDEDCDDGNGVDGDGCSAMCVFESTPLGDGGTFPRPGLAGDELDVFGLELEAPRRVRLWIDNGRGRCSDDSIMALERQEGPDWVLVTEDDDGGVTVCSRIDRPLSPGRYEVVVYGAAGDLAPYTLHARVQPEVGPGELCDRLGIGAACPVGYGCAPQGAAGICTALGQRRDEPEPDDFAEDVNPLAPDVTVRALLTPGFDGLDEVDLFAFRLDAPARLRVETGDGDGGCPGDTLLHRVDPEVWDVEGADAAIALALDSSDDTDNLRCSVLEADLPAGTHWFAVEEYDRDEFLSYAVMARALPLRGDGAACDAVLISPWGAPWFDRCEAGLVCADPDLDGAGVCAAP